LAASIAVPEQVIRWFSLVEYIEVFYNRKRRHSANDYKSPADYEMSLKAA
jgi:transposase InsO family protein